MITTNIDCTAAQVDPIEIKIKWHVVADRVSPTYHQIVMVLSTCFKPFLDGSVFAPLAKGFGVSMWGWENSKNDKPLHLYSHWYWNEALKFHFM